MKSYRIGPETERLLLRAMTVQDASCFYSLNSHPEVMRFTGESACTSVAAATSAIREYPDFGTVGFGRWGCYLRGREKLIGFCGLKYLPDVGEVDLGYRFLPEYWGQGLATEACRASVKFGFHTIQLQQIIAHVMPENTASIRVLEKVNMQLDGLREYDGHRVLQYRIEQRDFEDHDRNE